MSRQFNVGRQNEVLMSKKHYDIFKIMENYLQPPSSENPYEPQIDPPKENEERVEIAHNSLWVDNNNPNSSELKYYDSNRQNWNLFYKERFKITESLLSSEEPLEPIEGQLWIDSGTLKYYHQGQFKAIKAVPFDAGSVNPLGFEDFMIISPMEATENRVVDNFTEFLFAKTPILDWQEGKSYEVNEGAIYDLHIYMCKEAHTSSAENNILNEKYWTRLDFLNQFLVPDAPRDKFYIDGEFIHQKGALPVEDPNDTGYIIDTNTCISFPVEMVTGKLASAVHVNPSRLNNITKKFIKIDKTNPVIEVPEENTEFYGVQGGIGKLLIKTDNDRTTEYFSVIANDTNCIKLSAEVARRYDFIYAIHYEFVNVKVKQPGVLYKKKVKLQDENYVWIGPVDPDRICVFAQGLYYEKHSDNYIYDSQNQYLYIKERLQDYPNMVKNFDFSVIAFPKVYQGQVANNFHAEYGLRINLAVEPKSPNLLAFAGGVQLHMAGLDVMDDPQGNPRVKYIPSITAEVFANNPNMYWAIVEVNEYNSDNELVYKMWRGKTKAVKNQYGNVVVPIYRDEDSPVEGAIYFANNDYPIMFVDGVLAFQKEIEIGNDYLTIYGLKEGQDVVLLGDSKGDQQGEFENSDRLIFEDMVSYATIPTELCDNTLVYVSNGILCDAGAIYTSIQPRDEGYHGEIRQWVNYSTEQWMIYDRPSRSWKVIDPELTVTDPITQENKSYIEILDKNARGYTSTRKSISFLQNLGEQVCTYYAYLYSDSIEKQLLMDYCYPNNKDGINNDNAGPADPKPFSVNYKHLYVPGNNELTVYWNGIRQNLDSPYDIGYENSKNKECRNNKMFTLAYDDGTKQGKPINAFDGYYVYSITKGVENKSFGRTEPMPESERTQLESEGWTIKLLSEPTRNVLFYVIEPCESGEIRACERKKLTYKDALASSGAFANNTYTTGEFVLTRGNVRVFINGIRQPFGAYQTLEVLEQDKDKRASLEAYRIIDATTIQFNDILIGGMGGNEGDLYNPLYPIGENTDSEGNTFTVYHENIDEILIETRRDFKLREITLPIKDNTGEFTQQDGVPADLFKTKDKVMIYINGLAYGKEYKIENGTIKLLNESVRQQLGNSKRDVITFEWR